MSTTKIRELLRWAEAQDADTHAFDGTHVGPPPFTDVRAEVEAIERAAVNRDLDFFAALAEAVSSREDEQR